MRWTQALVFFGLAALLTFQVEQSSAATLRNAVAYSEGDEALSVDLANDEHDLGDLVKDLVEKAKQRLQKLREEIRAEIEKIKQQGAGAAAKDLAERIKLRLSQIREAAKKLGEALGETEIGKAAKQVAKQAEEAIQKIKDAINKGKPAAPTKPSPAAEEDEELLADGDLAQRLKERVEKVREAIRKELEKVKNMSKALAERVKARFEKIREAAKKLGEKLGETEVGAAAKRLAKEAEEAIQKIKEAIKGKPAEPTKPSGEEDEELLADGPLTELQKRIQERIEKMRESIWAEVDRLAGLPTEAVERARTRVEQIREAAKKIADLHGETVVGLAAKRVVSDADAALTKIKDRLKQKPATTVQPAKPTEPAKPAGEEDEELLADGPLTELQKRIQERIEKMREAVWAEIERLAGLPKEAVERARARIEKMREAAKKIADRLGDTALGTAAKRLEKDATDALNKIKEKLRGDKTAQSTTPAAPKPTAPAA